MMNFANSTFSEAWDAQTVNEVERKIADALRIFGCQLGAPLWRSQPCRPLGRTK
jgi:hypothetical protein